MTTTASAKGGCGLSYMPVAPATPVDLNRLLSRRQQRALSRQQWRSRMASFFLRMGLLMGILAVGSLVLLFVLNTLPGAHVPQSPVEDAPLWASPTPVKWSAVSRSLLQTSESFAGSQFDLECEWHWKPLLPPVFIVFYLGGGD